ncbi:MAG: SMC-Scp complex subunit ScpB [Parcubacteria group bacterium]|nr:SMC-Scp complex subunit ScpB [Parcubacteria group bacterium]
MTNTPIALDAKIEAILFFKSEPMSVSALSKILHAEEHAIRAALETLKERLQGRGVALLSKDDEVSLATTHEASALIEAIMKDELSRDLGKAGLETLSAILYQGPLTRAELDYIRGVNSTFILRNLLIRGLIEKIPNPKDQRSFLYRPTFELLSHLGISKIEDLPEYDAVQSEIAAFHGIEEKTDDAIKEAEEESTTSDEAEKADE